MKQFILFLLLLGFGKVPGQYKCSNSKDKDLSVKTCLHRNGTVSTREEWDKDKRSGRLKIYTNDGKMLQELQLRNFAGHASAHLSYHANGQVSRVEYSSAPDAGIQFYRASYAYNEEGKLTDKWEEEHPYRLYTEPMLLPEHEQPVRKESPKSPSPTLQCASPFFSVYEIRNLSGKKTRLSVKARPNLIVAGKNQEFTLKPGETRRVDSLVYAERHIEPGQVYELILEKGSEKNYTIVQLIPLNSAQTRYYTFLIIPR